MAMSDTNNYLFESASSSWNNWKCQLDATRCIKLAFQIISIGIWVISWRLALHLEILKSKMTLRESSLKTKNFCSIRLPTLDIVYLQTCSKTKHRKRFITWQTTAQKYVICHTKALKYETIKWAELFMGYERIPYVNESLQ